MLMAHPNVLRNLLERYTSLSAQAESASTGGAGGAEGVEPWLAQQLRDTAYTLCVSTGTREIGAALAAARARLAGEAANGGDDDAVDDELAEPAA